MNKAKHILSLFLRALSNPVPRHAPELDAPSSRSSRCVACSQWLPRVHAPSAAKERIDLSVRHENASRRAGALPPVLSLSRHGVACLSARAWLRRSLRGHAARKACMGCTALTLDSLASTARRRHAGAGALELQTAPSERAASPRVASRVAAARQRRWRCHGKRAGSAVCGAPSRVKRRRAAVARAHCVRRSQLAGVPACFCCYQPRSDVNRNAAARVERRGRARAATLQLTSDVGWQQ